MKKRTKRNNSKNRQILANTRVSGGIFTALSAGDMESIHCCVVELLSQVGMSDAPEVVTEVLVSNGGSIGNNGRLLFSPDLITRVLDELPKRLLLAGRGPECDLNLQGTRVYVGTGGAAPMMVDLNSGKYRSSTLEDLYNAARIVDTLDNVHFFSRPVVAGDMKNPKDLDINTTFASLAGTSKHVMVSAHDPANVREIARMCHIIAGSEKKFKQRPFLSLNINHVAPPMRFAQEACAVLAESVKQGIPAHINTFSQLGASSPVTIAGCVAQTIAETLAGMIFAWLLEPDAKLIFGVRPMLTDLRTGGMAGGSGEQALLTASVVQMAQFYGLPNSTIAGATDSKVADAQSGYEKCLSIGLAAHSGANMITQACGMQAGLMGCSFESYVIDNDMLGAILRTMVPVEVSESSLSAAMIGETIANDGHFLGSPDTLARMNSDFLYPTIADRSSPEEWEIAGAPEIRQQAKAKVQAILSEHFPMHLAANAEKMIRSEFDIKLPEKVMRPT